MMKQAVEVQVETHAAVAAREVMAQTRQTGGVTVMIGQTGSGKTTLLKSWVVDQMKDACPHGAVLYRAEVVNTPLSVLCGLLMALDTYWTGSTRDGFPELCVQMRLHGVDTIVVDDAQRLSGPAMDVLRALHERGGFALVLCGTERFVKRLVERCPELAHRVSRVHQLGEAEGDDVFAMLRNSPLLGASRRFEERLAMSRALVEASGGNLRRMNQVLEETRRRARSGHRAVNLRLLQGTAQAMPQHTLDVSKGA